MKITGHAKSLISPDEQSKAQEHLDVDLELKVTNLFETNPGESHEAAFSRQQVAIAEELSTLLNQKVIPKIAYSLKPRDISEGLTTDSHIHIDGSYTLSDHAINIDARMHIEADMVSDAHVALGESTLNARGNLAVDIASAVIQQARLKLFGHSSTKSTAKTSFVVKPDEAIKITEHKQIVSGSNNDVE